jgi:hypothetical protein
MHEPKEGFPLTWKNVLHVHNYKRLNHIYFAASFAHQLGYPYFIWDHRLHIVNEDGTHEELPHSVKDIV